MLNELIVLNAVKGATKSHSIVRLRKKHNCTIISSPVHLYFNYRNHNWLLPLIWFIVRRLALLQLIAKFSTLHWKIKSADFRSMTVPGAFQIQEQGYYNISLCWSPSAAAEPLLRIHDSTAFIPDLSSAFDSVVISHLGIDVSVSGVVLVGFISCLSNRSVLLWFRSITPNRSALPWLPKIWKVHCGRFRG